jgi:hypothetical protein
MGTVSQAPPQEQPSRTYQRSAPGLIGALLAVVGLIVVVWALSRFQHRAVADPAPPIDYRGQLVDARSAAPFPVLAPSPVPVGWQATSASWDGQPPDLTWHLGFLTAAGQYVALEQGRAPGADFVARSTPATVVGQPVTVAGHRWQTLSSSSGDDRALVRRSPAFTTVVTGTAPLSQLESFAASLSAQ